jgi:SpoVK/Ycf46/Vps4 family AAA+-type ATPase
VLPPDEPARLAILERALAERPVERVDARRLARQTDGFSGADLVHLVEAATEEALQRSAATGTLQPVTQADVDRARKDVRPSTRAWFEVAHNYALYANEGVLYDDLLAYIRERRLL